MVLILYLFILLCMSTTQEVSISGSDQLLDQLNY